MWKEMFPTENRYYETDLGILYLGDSKDILEKIPDKSVDLVLTDPPYEISSKNHNFHTMNDRKNKRTGTYFGDWDENFNMNIWEIICDKVNKNGSIVSFMSFEQYYLFSKIISKCGFVIKDRLVWEKSNPFPRNRDRRYIPNIELVVWATRKYAKWTFNRQNPKYESCVLKFPSESGCKYKRFHPTQKPLKLIQYLLNIHSNPGNIVLDPFAGSGTTAVACQSLNRFWINIELDKNYCQVIKSRLSHIENIP